MIGIELGKIVHKGCTKAVLKFEETAHERWRLLQEARVAQARNCQYAPVKLAYSKQGRHLKRATLE